LELEASATARLLQRAVSARQRRAMICALVGQLVALLGTHLAANATLGTSP
jgi:hypothetical protein